MTDKIVRDELLRSHRYQSLSSDTAKLLFLHVLLSSDGLSNAEATPTALSIIMGRAIPDDAAGALLDELAAHDLVRIYLDGEKRYVHIPRSRQRLRYINGKHPRPPASMEDNQIRDLLAKVGHKTGTSRAEVKRSEEKLKKSTSAEEPVDKSEVIHRLSTTPPNTTTTTPAGVDLRKPITWAEHWQAQGKALGIEPNRGESTSDYCHRIIDTVKQRTGATR